MSAADRYMCAAGETMVRVYCRSLLAFTLLVAASAIADVSIRAAGAQLPDLALLATSDVVLTGKVAGIVSGWDSRAGAIYTYVTVDVEQMLKGWVPRRRIVVKQLGGRSGEVSLSVAGQPTFRAGEHTLLFLEVRPRDNTLYSAGLWQGKWNIEADATGALLAVRTRPGTHRVFASRRDTRPLNAWLEQLRTSAGAAALRPTGLAINIEPQDAPNGSGSSLISPPAFQWQGATAAAAIDVVVQADGQQGLAGGGFSEIASALSLWNSMGMIRFKAPGLTAGHCSLGYEANGRITFNFNNGCGELSDHGATISVTGVYAAAPDANGIGAARQAFILNGNAPAGQEMLTNPSCFQFLEAHELGHAIGLNDTDDETALMAPVSQAPCSAQPIVTFGRASLRPRLGGGDLAAAEELYPDPGSLVAPGSPSNLGATVTGSTVVLIWTAPASGDPATTYVLQAGSAAGLSNLANFSTGSTATTYTANGVAAGTYFVRVLAGNGAGQSAPSNEITITVGGATNAPGAPAAVTAAVSGSTVTLAWTAPLSGGAPTTYWLEAGSAPGASNLANFSTGSTTTGYVATGVPNGTYYVRVRAGNAFGISAASNEVTIVVGGTGGTGLLAGAVDFPGPYPTPVSVAYTDRTGRSVNLTVYPGQVLVFFNAGTPQIDAERAIQMVGGTVLAKIPVVGYYLAGVPLGQEVAFLNRIELDSRVAIAELHLPGSLDAGATILDGCDQQHGLSVRDIIVTQGGTFGRCIDIVDPGTTRVNDNKLTRAIITDASQSSSDPILINLSSSGGPNGIDYMAPGAQKSNLEQWWKWGIRTRLAAVASLPESYRDRLVITIAAGNANMPIDSLLADLRADPKIAGVLKNNVILVTTTTSMFDFANRTNGDPDVVIMTNQAAKSGTSYASPAALADIQNIMAATGASVKIALQAAKLAAATNANHELKRPEAIVKAQAILKAGKTDPPAAANITSIAFTSVGGTTAAIVSPAISGVTVQYSVSGTDGYFDSGSLQTNSSGRVTFSIPPGSSGVVDTISVTAVLSGKVARTNYRW